MSRTVNLLTFIFLTASISIVNAQPPQMNFTVKGKVLENETGKPMEYVNVVIWSARDSSLVTGAITLADGTFSIVVPHPGKFYVSANFIGFKKNYISNVLLKPGASNIFDAGEIKLKPETRSIDEVEVVADRPYVSYQIDKKVVDVSLNPSAQGGTAVDALQNVPSVQTDIEGNVTLRGSSNFTVLIDGRQSPLSGSDALNQIPASSIDKIELITNPSVKYDPDGTAGIINIVSKKGKLDGHSAVINTSIGNSPMYSGDVTYTYRQKKTTVTTSVNYRNGTFQFNNTDNTTNQIAPDTISFSDKYIKGKMQFVRFSAKTFVDYQLTKSNILTIGGEYSDFNFNRNFDSKINNINTEGLNTYVMSNTQAGASPSGWQLNFGNKQTFKGNTENYLTVDFMAQKRNSSDNDFLESDSTNNEWLTKYLVSSKEKAVTNEDAMRYRLEADYSLPISEKFKFEAGYTLRVNNSSQDYRRYEFDILNSEFNDHADFSRYINAGWFLVKGKLFGVQYSAGFRGEMTNQLIKTVKDTSRYKYDYFGKYPSFAVSKEFKGGNQLQFNYSRRINRPRDRHLNPFPNLSDGYTLFKPNPGLKPEYASSYEFNYQKSWGSSFISAETFYRKTDNKMERVMEIESDTLTVRTIINLGSDTRMGGEVMANIKFAPWFILNSSASLYRSTVEGNYNGEYLTRNSDNWRGSMMCIFMLPSKTRIQFSGDYRSPNIEIDGREKEQYWVSAAMRQEFFKRKLSASLSVRDIFSTRKHRQTTISGNTTLYSEHSRKSPMVFLSLSYKFNQNGDKKKSFRQDDAGDNGDNSGGMDMGF